MESSELQFGRLNQEFCGKPSITFIVLKEAYMLTYHHFRTVNSFSLHYASILLQPFCLHLLLSAPFLPLTKHPAPQACKCLWHKGMCGWWNGNPSGCWHTHFSGFSFIPTFLLVLEAKPPCDCAPRVWEHGNHW